MAGEKRSGEELLEEPEIGFSDGSPNMDTPFDMTIDILTETGGERLELMCRATPQIVDAASIAYNLKTRFNCRYIGGRMEMIERFSVSHRGMGRDEMVRSLQAGSGVSDGFYESQSGVNKGFVEE